MRPVEDPFYSFPQPKFDGELVNHFDLPVISPAPPGEEQLNFYVIYVSGVYAHKSRSRQL